MNEIEELTINNYNENMNFFREKHPSLYNKLSALDILLNDGTYPQKYDLEYKDTYFDVKELNSNAYLYSNNSDEFGDKLTDDISMKKNEQVCETFLNYKFTPEAINKANESEAIFIHATTAPIISYYDQYITKDMNFKAIRKFLFLGLGLATHIPKIMQKIHPEIVLFVEDDIELFRLSLFTCNYKEALGRSIGHFSISENEDEFRAMLNSFYAKSSIQNHYLKFSLFNKDYQNKIKKFQEYVVSRSEKCYSHERILTKNQRVLEKIEEKYNFLDLQNKENETFFNNKPILVIGAGPSLHENIQWLKENKDNFILLAVFAAVKTLYKHDITPDIVIQLDEKVPEATMLINSFDDLSFLDNSIFILSASCPNVLFETFNKKNIFVVEDRSYYKQRVLQIVASSVGEVAYSIALIFNTTNTYLLGLDLALGDDGRSHAKDHHGSQKIDISDTQSVPTVTSLQLSSFKIKGNFRDEVICTPLLASSIPKLNRYTKLLKSPLQNVYNLCDGAYFLDVIPLHPKDVKGIKKITKINLQKEIYDVFSKYSTSILSDEELTSIEFRKEQIKTFNNILSIFENTPSTTDELFIAAYKKLVISLIAIDKSELRELIMVYLFNTTGYVVDFFNTKELNDIKKHTKNMKKIVALQLRRIINFYDKTINTL